MSGASIAAEVAAALVDVAGDVGDGSFVVTLKVTTGAPDTPWGTGGTVTEYELPAMVQDYPRSMIDGTLIQVSDRRVMIAATEQRPSTADKLRIGGVDYRIISVKDLAPSGVPIYYEAQARV